MTKTIEPPVSVVVSGEPEPVQIARKTIPPIVEKGAEWTAKLGKCHFCHKTENGYAKKDKDGKFYPSCWPCVKPKESDA